MRRIIFLHFYYLSFKINFFESFEFLKRKYKKKLDISQILCIFWKYRSFQLKFTLFIFLKNFDLLNNFVVFKLFDTILIRNLKNLKNLICDKSICLRIYSCES